ncbi:hypothetical protein HYQ44_008990 [Verticillium longisporum]|nr:hypothetical protein HYQ44_008990 [Verticillium longisporum]
MPRHSPAAIRAATRSIRFIRWLGGLSKISHVLATIAMGTRRTRSSRLRVGSRLIEVAVGENRLAAGGSGESARLTEMLLVVAR